MLHFVRWMAVSATMGALACATPLGFADAYNVFVFGDFRPTGADTGGRVAAGGTAVLSGYSVAQGPNHASPSNSNNFDGTFSLVAGDLITANGGTVFSGNVWDGRTPGDVHITLPRRGQQVVDGEDEESPVDFAAAKSSLQRQSTYWGSLLPTGVVKNEWGGLTLNATEPGLNVFTLPASLLASSWGLNITGVTAEMTVLINVTGNATIDSRGSITINGRPSSGDSTTELVSRVIFNFPEATGPLVLQRSFLGSVLAPYADVNASNGQMAGQLIANSFTGNYEFHDFRFTGDDLPNEPVPEPLTVVLTGGGLLAVALLRRRSAALLS